MANSLRSVLELRREAERTAQVTLEDALTALAKAEQEEDHLRQELRVARAALTIEDRQPRAAPKSAAEALARARYRERLVEKVARATQELEAYGSGPGATLRRAEEEARTAFEEAHKALEAALTLEEHQAVEVARQAERRAEDAADDHVNAVYVHRRERT